MFGGLFWGRIGMTSIRSRLGRWSLRHLGGLLAAAVVLAFSPAIAAWVSAWLSSAFGVTSWMEIHPASWGGSQVHLHDADLIIEPLSPALFVVLAGVAALCALADLLRPRVPQVTWGFPLLLAVLAAIGVSAAVPPDGLPRVAPALMGATIGVLVLLLVGSYWLVLVWTDGSFRFNPRP